MNTISGTVGDAPSGKRDGKLTVRMAVGLAAPHTFAASACPALFGILYCVYRQFPIRFYEEVMLFAACVLMQSSVNTLNDYMDFVSGADTAEDNVEKSDSIIVFSDLAPHRALALGCGYLAAALLIGSYFVFRRGPAPLIIGVIGALVVVLYSAGPLPVSHLPLGEIVSGFVMGGLIPLGIAAAVMGEIHLEILPYCIPFILGIGLIMMTNNTCDIEKDIQAGRRTLPDMIGRQRAVLLYRSLVLLWIVSIFLYALSLHPLAGVVGALMLIPGYLFAFRYLLHSPLIPATRIAQMKGILKANLTGAAICLVVLAAVTAVRSV